MSVDYRRFQIHSKAPTDIIVLSHEGEGDSSETAWPSFSFSFGHGLSFTPLVFGLYSVDGGITWNDIQSSWSDRVFSLSANSSTVTGQALFFGTYATAHIKYRIFGFAPSTASSDSVTPPTPLSRFYINSRNKYDTLITAGVASVRHALAPQTILTHNLGYIPRVMLWSESSGSITPINTASNYVGASSGTGLKYATISSTDLKFRNYSTVGAADAFTLHYRLYGGSNG